MRLIYTCMFLVALIGSNSNAYSQDTVPPHDSLKIPSAILGATRTINIFSDAPSAKKFN